MRAILMYHSIDSSGSPLSIAPEVFDEHVRWLSRGPLRVLPIDGLLAGEGDGSGDALAITFDDGFANIEGALRRLEDHGLPATVFVVTGHVGGTNAWGGRAQARIPTLPLLDWPALERLVARGVRIGAHTTTHPHLTTLPVGAVGDELGGCASTLRARLGVSASWLAYPYGAVDDRVTAIASAWFSVGVTTQFAPLSAQDPQLQIPRLDTYYFRRPGSLPAWGSARFTRYLRSVRVRRRVRNAIVRR